MPSPTLPLPRKHDSATRAAIARYAYANRYAPNAGITVFPPSYRARPFPAVARSLELRYYIAQRRFHFAVADAAQAMHRPAAIAAAVLRNRRKRGLPNDTRVSV